MSCTKIKCLVCASDAFLLKKINDDYDVMKCTGCMMEFAHPMPTEGQLNEFYAGYSDVRADDVVVKTNAKRNMSNLSKYGLSRDSLLLDYGSGKGAFVEMSESDQWYNYDRFTSDDDEAVLKKGPFSWVTMWSVLEHVIDPVSVMENISEMIQPEGFFAATTVCIEFSIPWQYKPPEHVTYWTKAAITYLLDQVGMELIELRQYYMKQLSDIYMSIILRTVPDVYRKKIKYNLPDMVEVPTNEVFFVAKKR